MEIWKEIINTGGNYLISNLGRVKSIQRIVYHKNNTTTNRKERFLKLSKCKKGYLTANMYYNGEKLQIKVHRLVATHFIDNPMKLSQVNHIDLNKTNNSVDNLEWVDNRENVTHYRSSIKSTSEYVGVHYDKKSVKFVSQIHIQGITYTLGRFISEDEAIIFYNKALFNWENNRIKPNIKRNKGYIKKDLKGNIIKYYKSLNDLKKDGYNISSVSMSVNGNYPYKNNKYKNLIWEREK